ncbi:unnamed protein product [Heterobilharzia americana]|nr:unnamed protein product [Heterobilharzia americana]CAH8534035.1 unnamed protein product [Heterobilharzia americana]
MSHIEGLNGELISKLTRYMRYVNDVTVICDKHKDATCFPERLNIVQNSISLTCEEEKDNRLPFLHTLLSRMKDGSIKQSIYIKPTWTGQYLSFHTFFLSQYKRSLIICLFKTIQRICTKDNECWHQNTNGNISG